MVEPRAPLATAHSSKLAGVECPWHPVVPDLVGHWNGLTMPDKPSREQRHELGAFLSNQRALLHPSEFGLPTGPRRTPGLRREEIALLAGVSVSWYTWLEQGRDIQPSSDALRRLATVFKLNRVEFSYLFALASRDRPVFETLGQVGEALNLLVRTIDPIPAYVRNSRLDIVAWNDAASEVFVDYGSLLPYERNSMRLMFLYEPYRALFINWSVMARGTIANFRAARAESADKAPFDDLVNEISARSAEFRDWWRGTDVKGFDDPTYSIQHPILGLIVLNHISLAPQSQPDLSLTIFVPRSSGYDSKS